MWTDAYRQALSFASMQVATGAIDYNTAIRQAIKPFTDSGICTIGYQSGRTFSIEAAARLSVLNGVSQMAQEVSNANGEAFGADGYELSAHSACAPDHEPYQGRQYTLKEYEALQNRLARPIGTLNCGHIAYPIILGISERAYSDAELDRMAKENAEGIDYEGEHYTKYEATQMQRRLERAIRKTKRELIGADEAGDKDMFTAKSIKLRRLREYYGDFSNKAGLITQNERAQVAGFTRSMSGKVLQAERKEVEKYSVYHYNKNGAIKVTDDWKDKKKPSIPKEFKPYAVIETKTEYKNGAEQIDRSFYDASGKLDTQVHSGPHNRPKMHPYGEHGEHGHSYIWEDGKIADRLTRELNMAEREENNDIL